MPALAPVLVDTGMLVALLDRLDAHHAAVAAWVASNDATWLTVSAVLSEAAIFLPVRLRIALAGLAETSCVHRIATLDVADFSVYRIHGRKRFELALLG